MISARIVQELQCKLHCTSQNECSAMLPKGIALHWRYTPLFWRQQCNISFALNKD
jgi:hypothetical protein